MLWTIKKFENQKFVCVRLFSWEILLTDQSIERIFDALQSGSKFVKISWNVVNVNEIKLVEPYQPTDVEIFIATQSDWTIKKELQKIYDERNSKWLKTKWPDHLRSIYQNRFNS